MGECGLRSTRSPCDDQLSNSHNLKSCWSAAVVRRKLMLVILGTKRVLKEDSINSIWNPVYCCLFSHISFYWFISVSLYSTHGTCALVLGTDLFRHSEMMISERSGHRNSPVDNITVRLLANNNSNKFLLVTSMLCKTGCSWQLRTWSHKMNFLDINFINFSPLLL